MKKVLYTLLICLLGVHGVEAQNYLRADSYLFSFQESKNLLLADYGDNAFALQRMNEGLLSVRPQLLDGKYHILIVAHVDAYRYADEAVVNEASLRASRIRAYIKSKLNIPHESIAFYIDRSGRFRDQVHVYLVESALPWFVNQDINYTESPLPGAMKEVVKRYGSVPYVDLYPRGSANGESRAVYVITDGLFDPSELEDYRLAITEMPSPSNKGASKNVSPAVASEEQTVSQAPLQKAKPHKAERKETETAPFKFAVKMNLLPWCTVVPSVVLGNNDAEIQTGSFMPNLELEYYFANRWSVALSGTYADFSYNGNKDNKWAVSGLTLTPKVWPMADYRWLSVGLFGEYGDFDVRGEKISTSGLYGRTGRFWSAGASIGCLIPIYSGFCIEAEAQAGYRSVFNGKKYRYDDIDSKNYLETRFSSTGFMIGLKVNLLYRFGF
ncbi:DUF3575 domain-containing protein [Parabacteroides bouchesdurhonensis]|uniref:DUF3575 domain-containing protein n=1 Tax=Parabacteroides bouchesdurhonensis TaxID=1936995 RepID=UPI000C86641D|nr:DUF3575 domain-containing protein [Parabacteroides bouchesdurhonensis]